MTSTPTRGSLPASVQPSEPVGRRRLLVGAGVAGAAAVAAHVAHRAATDAPVAATPDAKGTAEGEGYRLTPHVRRYYETTKA
jgi:hypothetical protein